jgi:hypothetical protein
VIKVRYRRWPIRLPSLTLAQLSGLVLSEGWQLSDLLGHLLPSPRSPLGLEGEENLGRLRSMAELGQRPDDLPDR